MNTQLLPWTASLVECNCCAHRWVAVYQTHLLRLECPHCTHFTLFNIIPHEVL
jgi:hypothetical protein